MHTTPPDFETKRKIAERKAQHEQAKRNIVFAQTGDEFHKARELWANAWKSYERAVEDSEARHETWLQAATQLQVTNDLGSTAQAIQKARMVFKKYLMENAEINGSFQEAYFTTTRDAEFARLRGEIETATHAYAAAVRAHHFDAETIPEYYLWRISQKRMHACWQLAEVAMAEIETIANVNAMGRFAATEGLAGEAAEIISTAYYARYPMSELHPCLSESLFNGLGHVGIGSLAENSLERETEIAARITGDRLLAVPMSEVSHEIRERLEKISPERQVQLTKQYAEDLGLAGDHEAADLGPGKTIASSGWHPTVKSAVDAALEMKDADPEETPEE